MDDRVIRADWDAGFVEGRQYGRGKHGGQVRDEYRKDYDPERGGYNRAIAQKSKNYWENRRRRHASVLVPISIQSRQSHCFLLYLFKTITIGVFLLKNKKN